MKGSGGKRQGAGRKAPDTDDKLYRKNVMLTQADIDYFRRIGNGELSMGIRLARKEARNGLA